jgi:hypothetical protein
MKRPEVGAIPPMAICVFDSATRRTLPSGWALGPQQQEIRARFRIIARVFKFNNLAFA